MVNFEVIFFFESPVFFPLIRFGVIYRFFLSFRREQTYFLQRVFPSSMFAPNFIHKNIHFFPQFCRSVMYTTFSFYLKQKSLHFLFIKVYTHHSMKRERKDGKREKRLSYNITDSKKEEEEEKKSAALREWICVCVAS